MERIYSFSAISVSDENAGLDFLPNRPNPVATVATQTNTNIEMENISKSMTMSLPFHA